MIEQVQNKGFLSPFQENLESEVPSLSIGICTSNDERTINYLLKNIIKNLFDKEINLREIIIVSSGCIDKTEIIIEKYSRKYPNFINLIKENKRSGKNSAINIILKEFRGDALILVPADVILQTNSISLLKKKLFSCEKIGIVSGRPLLITKHSKINLIGRIAGFLWMLHNRTLGLSINTHATGELMILRKNVALQLPNFIINDDAFIALETINQNFSVEYEKNAIVYISVPHMLRDYIVQRKRVLKGHKQLKSLKGKNTTTFREIFRTNKLLSLKLLFHEVKNVQSLMYFTLAVVIEMYIEIDLIFTKNNDLKNESVWNRVNTINSVLNN